MPKWYHFEQHCFWKWYQNGITFRNRAFECHTIFVLLPETVLLLGTVLLRLIPEWYYFSTYKHVYVASVAAQVYTSELRWSLLIYAGWQVWVLAKANAMKANCGQQLRIWMHHSWENVTAACGAHLLAHVSRMYNRDVKIHRQRWQSVFWHGTSSQCALPQATRTVFWLGTNSQYAQRKKPRHGAPTSGMQMCAYLAQT